MSGFLTDDDLERLTGYTQPSAQARRLREMGIQPLLSSTGRPLVCWGVVEALQLQMSGVESRRSEPNWEAMG